MSVQPMNIPPLNIQHVNVQPGGVATMMSGQPGSHMSMMSGQSGTLTSMMSGQSGTLTSMRSGQSGTLTSMMSGQSGTLTSMMSGQSGTLTSMMSGQSGGVTSMSRVVDFDNNNFSKEIITETVEETKTELVPQLIPENPPEETVTYINGKCTCCPYGYHVDVDFVRYCDALANGSYLRRLKKIKKTKRKLRKSMEVFLQQQERTHQELHSYPPPDVVHSSESFITQVARDDSASNPILDEIDSSVEATLASIDYMMRPPAKFRESSIESDDSLSPVYMKYSNTFPKTMRGLPDEPSLTANSRTDSTSSLSSQSTFSSENPSSGFTETTTNITKTQHTRVTSAQLAETLANHLPEITQTTTVTSQCPGPHITHASLQAIREAMAISLQRMKELEEQVKAIPVLQVRISVLKEEKRLLNLQLKAKNNRLNMRSIGVGDFSIDEPERSSSSTVTETRRFLTSVQSPKPYGHSSSTSSVSNFLAAQQQRASTRSIGVGDHSVDFFYLHQPHIATPYENNIINQTSTHTHEKQTVVLSQNVPDNSLKSSRFAFTKHLINNNNQKPLTRSIGVGDGNVFDSKSSGYHIHEKELRTVIIGQAPGTTGKRNVGVECKVPTRDVGISYSCDSEKPATRSIGVGVTDGSHGGISVKFEGEDWKTMVREVLKKNVRTVGTNCRMQPEMRDVGIMHAWSDTRTVGCGTDSVDVIIKPVTAVQSIGIMAVPDVRNSGNATDKGWKLDAFTNTPRKVFIPKGINTEATRSSSQGCMTDGASVSNKVAQTETKIFLATDVIRHTGCNTTNVRTQNTGVNTESKLMTSDKFNMDITFKENSSNTAFDVEDRSSNTGQRRTTETWEKRLGGGGGDEQSSSEVTTVTRQGYSRYLPRNEDENTTTIRKVEISSSIPTTMEKTVKRTKKLSPAELESMMGEFERTVQSQEGVSSSSWESGGGDSRTGWQREITSSGPTSGGEWSQTTRTMMLGGSVGGGGKIYGGGRGSYGSSSMESGGIHSSRMESGGMHSSSMESGGMHSSGMEFGGMHSSGMESGGMHSSSYESSSAIGGVGGGTGGSRTVIQRNIKKVRSGGSDVVVPEYKPSHVEEEEARESRFIRLEEGDMDEDKADDTVTEATEEFLVRDFGEGMDVIQIGGVPEHVVSGTDVTDHKHAKQEGSETISESYSSSGGRLSREGVVAEFDRVRRQNREALVGNGSGGSGGYTKTTKITVGGIGSPSKERSLKKTITVSGSGMGGGSSSSSEMMQSSGGSSGVSASSSFESSGMSSSGMSESYGSSGSGVSRSHRSGGNMGSMMSGGGQALMSSGDDFMDDEFESGGGSYSMTTDSQSSGSGPHLERTVKTTYMSSGGIQSDGGGFHNRHAFSHGNVNEGHVETGLKSIMKRSSSEPQVKKGIKFAESVVGGYDSTSSEESDHSDSESSTSSFEEGSYDGRQGNIVYTCQDDEAIAKGIPGAVMYDQNIRETYELPTEMVMACKILAKYLDDSTTVQTKELNASLNIIQADWFKASSQKLSNVHMVEDYLSSFNEISRHLLEYILNITDTNGNSALHYAVSNCNFEVVSLLLDTGLIDVDKQNKAGYSVIMLAALSSVQTGKDVHVVKQLFDSGDVNARASQAGQTALMLAVSHGRIEMVEMLLEAGANVNIQDDDGSTALMCACEHGHTEIVKTLLAHPGCDANLTDNDGSTALSIAMEAGHKDVGVQLYAHLNFSKQASPGLTRKQRKGSGSPLSSISRW